MDEVTVSVPRGIRKGALIRYSGLGEKRPNLPAGDLIFKVQEIPHERFKRQKDDLMYPFYFHFIFSLTCEVMYIRCHLGEH